jgi:hypothetical protein
VAEANRMTMPFDEKLTGAEMTNTKQCRTSGTDNRSDEENEIHELGLCPICNALKIIGIAGNLNPRLKCMDGNDVTYQEEGQDEKTVTADFGVVSVRHAVRPETRLEIFSFGQLVMQGGGPAGKVSVLEPGPWLETLAAIRADIEGKFGELPVEHSPPGLAH